MDAETTIGVAIIAGALFVIIVLVLLGRRSIDRIASRGFGSAREITRGRRVRK